MNIFVATTTAAIEIARVAIIPLLALILLGRRRIADLRTEEEEEEEEAESMMVTFVL